MTLISTPSGYKCRLQRLFSAPQVERSERISQMNPAVLNIKTDWKASFIWRPTPVFQNRGGGVGQNDSKPDFRRGSAERRVANIRSALAATHAKQAAEQAETARQAQRDHEQKILQAAEARHAAGKALAQSSKQFANDYLKLLLANESLAALLPPDRDIFADLTERSTLETMLRRNLAKLGLPWAFPCPFGTVDIPELPAQLEAALGVVRRSVPKDSQK